MFEGMVDEVIWSKGRLQIIRHCDGYFSLKVDGVVDMAGVKFSDICRYIRLEYDY